MWDFRLNPTRRRGRAPALHYAILVWLSLLPSLTAGAWAGAPGLPLAPIAQEDNTPRPLSIGVPIERELAGGQAHSYQVVLAAGQYLNLAVEQRGIDVAVTLFGPDGQKQVEVDSPNGPNGPESLSFIATVSGSYRVEIRAVSKDAPAAKYEIKLAALRAATEDDRALAEASRLSEEARKLDDQGKYDEALAPAARALAIREKLLDPNHAEVAASLNLLAGIYLDKADYVKAEPLYHRAIAIREKALGPDHIDLSESLNDLAVLYLNQADFERALPLYERSLQIREKWWGPEHPDVAQALSNLAGPYEHKGDYARAEALYRRALQIREKFYGPEHVEVADSLGKLAAIARNLGDFSKSEQLYQRVLAVREKALGPEHPEVAEALNNLALLHHDKGDYAAAEPLYQRSVAIREKALGPDHPFLAITLSNLATLYADQGESEKAEQTFKRALAIKEKALGPEHPSLAQTLNLLGGLYREEENYRASEPLLKRGLAIREKALGPDHPETAMSLFGLAKLYALQGNKEPAQALYQRAVSILEKAFGPEHPWLVPALDGQALLAGEAGQYEKAEAFFQRSLAIQEKTLNPDSPEIARSLGNLAGVYWAKGDAAQTIAYLTRAVEVSERSLSRHLLFGSESQKLSYLKLFSNDTNNALSLHAQVAPRDPQALRLALTTLLRRKGRALDAMADTVAALRRRARPQDQALFNQLAEARSHLATLTLRGPGNTPATVYRSQLTKLEDEVEKLESTLSARSAEFRSQSQPVTLEAIQAALPEGTALIEFALYRPVEPKTKQTGHPRYAAYLLTRQKPAQWVDLGEAAPIDRAVESWRETLRDPKRAEVKQLSRALDEKVMQPVRALLGETQHLLVSPDGSLNLIPFAALLDGEGKYLVERYPVTYLTSGRDLLRLQVARESRSAPVIVADPEFGDPPVVAARGDASRKGAPGAKARFDDSQIYFAPLSGVRSEIRAITELLPQAKLLTQEQATEAALKQVAGPRILHIATHGFFLQEGTSAPVGTRAGVAVGEDLRLGKWAVSVKNPLLRSGLALAGANRGQSGEDDGVLTALEAAGLDLWGTKLVVLSACDTGVGEVKNGDGVYGLRRALVLAGAESQLMSLWPVSDRSTRDLMVGYYQALGRGQGRGEALRQVQLHMLRDPEQQHPFYWASFIQSGEWASLEGKR